MTQDVLTILFCPLIFAALGGIYGFQRFPERRASLLLNLISFQLFGAFMCRVQPSLSLMTVMSLYSLVVVCLLVLHLQNPVQTPAPVQADRR